ncbi:MAG: choice-of-anchor Q domain-containing protein [Thermoanaerobaculia bacterium]
MSDTNPTTLRSTRLISTLFCLLLLSIPLAATAQWHVDPNGMAGPCTVAQPCDLIADAVAVAAPGDTVNVAAGTYFESGITIPSSLTILGSGALSTIVDGAGAGPVFTVMAPGGSVFIRRLTIQNGNAGFANGGAIDLQSGNLAVIASRVLGCTALAGGAIAQASTGQLLVSGTLIQGNNSTATGGGIWCDTCGGVAVLASFLLDNVAGSTGGAIHAQVTDVDVWFSSISGNEADDGGGIYALSSFVRVFDSAVWSNHADAGDGGGLFVTGTLDVERSAITDNTAFDNGGALFMSGNSVLAMGNTTISGNVALCGGGLSLVDNFGFGPTAIIGTATFYGNSSSYGGCAEQIQTGLSGTTELYNSIMTAAGIQCSSPLASGNHNLIDDATCDTGLASFNLGVVTLLDPVLAFNGGLTRTHAIDPASNAVDTGRNAACLNPGTGAPLVVDQRNLPRPVNGTCDIGAVELQ